MRDLAPCLPDLDYLFMNEDEARMATGAADPAAAARTVLELGARAAVIKLGPRGCGIYTAEGEFLCPAFDVPVKDTTGAGDCFVAGFLAARLKGADLYEAGRFANAVGAFSVQCVGAATGVKGFDETQSWMNCR
jgi:sugar/nucleoside kinase (ribokinase family)